MFVYVVSFVWQKTLSQMSLSNGGSSLILQHSVPSDEALQLQGNIRIISSLYSLSVVVITLRGDRDIIWVKKCGYHHSLRLI